jgi:hypothetical protein
VQRHQDPWSEGGQLEGRRSEVAEVPLGVEGDALGARRLGLKLCTISKLRGRIGGRLALVNMDGVEDMAGFGSEAAASRAPCEDSMHVTVVAQVERENYKEIKHRVESVSFGRYCCLRRELLGQRCEHAALDNVRRSRLPGSGD